MQQPTAAPASSGCCEAPGCRLQGEYRAPFARDRLDQYRWFCLEHVRDYNKKWDYFAGLDASEIEAAYPRRYHVAPSGLAARRPAQRRSRKSQDPLGLSDEAGLGEKPPPQMDGSEQLTPAERNAMGVLELSWPD